MFMMRSRAHLQRPIEEVYSELVNGLEAASTQDWPFDRTKAPKAELDDAEFVEVFTLTRCYNRRVRSSANFHRRYAGRGDRPMFDDWFHIDWVPKPDNYSAFVAEVFPAYIAAFRPYRASVIPDELISKDFERERKLNGRYQVGRVYPVDFFDADLCRSAFDKPPRECVKLIRRCGVPVELFSGGVMIRTPKTLSERECDQLSLLVRRVLGQVGRGKPRSDTTAVRRTETDD